MALHTSTFISRNTADLLAHISHLRPTLSAHPLLYTISVSQLTDPAQLSQLVSSVQSISSNSVGCLSAPIPSARSAWQQRTALSLASFDDAHATLFRSAIPGRKAAQVGRWHAMHQKEKEPDNMDYSQHIDWENALADSHEGSALPSALQSLSADSVNGVLYLSDKAPEGLTSALGKYRNATKLGFIGTSTPFVTGRPYTLFHNDAVYSDGAVGVCLSTPTLPSLRSDFPGLEAVTRPMIVTSTEGNLVNALDGANPSRLLLHALQNHPAAPTPENQNVPKELRVYIGTLNQHKGVYEVSQLFYVMSGDPSRGSIALDSDTAPAEGSLVQFFVLPPSAKADVLGEAQRRSGAPRSLTFATTSVEELSAASPAEDEDGPEDDTVVLPDVFLAASENGCLVSRAGESGSEKPWKSVVPGGLTSLRWSA
ncbi:hypothetical protein BD311DRAFT_785251 [Dichomitus squalens]|uniref:FIST domain-containing protein n=1 Tax=Dichomitus squalens TaxID=114155 RepID=A0A4Q9N1V7_9APHY|nr:hypothetical protein BD311DRAFT_785251 [Dichomitus squalens]